MANMHLSEGDERRSCLDLSCQNGVNFHAERIFWALIFRCRWGGGSNSHAFRRGPARIPHPSR